MANVEDPKIAQAYQDIRKDATGVNWVILKYSNPTTLQVESTGSGGPAEAIGHLRDDECQYGFYKITFKGDDETTRTKFALFSWAGEKASALKKAKMSVHKASVKSVFTDFAVDIHTSNKDELSEEHVLARIKKVNY